MMDKEFQEILGNIRWKLFLFLFINSTKIDESFNICINSFFPYLLYLYFEQLMSNVIYACNIICIKYSEYNLHILQYYMNLKLYEFKCSLVFFCFLAI